MHAYFCAHKAAVKIKDINLKDCTAPTYLSANVTRFNIDTPK